MPYKPRAKVAALLDKALEYVNSVQYNVTARWVFYRLLQDGTFSEKGDYKKLLSYLSKARKNFANGWQPWTLADDTRSAIVRGSGYDDPDQWKRSVAENTQCILDRWANQDNYVEIWFEAAAMQAQFRYHSNENIPLLAFHGDVSIPAKWAAAERIARRWLRLHKPIIILYYGDLDPKGLSIPESAERDVWAMVCQAIMIQVRQDGESANYAQAEAEQFVLNWTFERIGLNEDQVLDHNIPENPERPGTYQWEGVPDDVAEELIGESERYLDLDAFDKVEERENAATEKFRRHVSQLNLTERTPVDLSMECQYCQENINESGCGENRRELLNMLWSHLNYEHDSEPDFNERMMAIEREIEEIEAEM